MELLTGKSLADFNHYVHNNTEYNDYDLPRESYRVLESLIIEWLDSVGLFFNIYHDFNCRFYFDVDIKDSTIKSNFGTCNYNNRIEATKQSIIHANKIYNEKN